jgi:hypothetical protein
MNRGIVRARRRAPPWISAISERLLANEKRWGIKADQPYLTTLESTQSGCFASGDHDYMNSEFGPNDSAVDAYLHKLRHNKWFAKVGTPLDDERVVVASSWEVAGKQARNPSNGKWNKVATDILNSSPREKERQAAFQISWKIAWDATSTMVRDAARDIGCAAMEIVVADLIDSTYFRELADWYLRGHWPSGYDDNSGKRKVIVY